MSLGRAGERRVVRRPRRVTIMEGSLGGLGEVRGGFSAFCVNTISALATGQPLARSQPTIPLSRLEMLVAFYAPDLEESLRKILAARDATFLDPVPKVLGGQQTDDKSKGQAMVTLYSGMAAMDAACNDLMRAAAQEARKHSAAKSS